MIQTEQIIAVTGATGMVGSHVVAALLTAGHRPVLLMRSSSRLDTLKRTLGLFGLESELDTLEIRRTALNNPLTLSEALEGVDVLCNCAAVVDFDPQHDIDLIRINTEIAGHAVNSCLALGIRLIHVSSVATLGPAAPGETFITENCMLTSTDGRSAYSVSKFYAENEVWRGIAQGLEAVIVNPSIILGEGDWETGSSRIIAFGVGNHFYTTGVKGYVDVRDVARAIVLLIPAAGALGKRFILSAANLSFLELFTAINEAAGKHPPGIKTGEGLLRIASFADAIIHRLTGRERGISSETINNAVDSSFYDGERVTRFIDFAYTPIGETIRRVTCQYIADKEQL